MNFSNDTEILVIFAIVFVAVEAFLMLSKGKSITKVSRPVTILFIAAFAGWVLYEGTRAFVSPEQQLITFGLGCLAGFFLARKG